MSTTDDARAEAVEALDRLTQIALDNTSEDVHEAVYEDAKRVRAEWQVSRKVEVAPSDTDRETAIASVEYSRDTHIKWRDWLRVNPNDPAAEIAGDVTAHEQFIARYDNVLSVLRTPQPVQAEVTNAMVERGLEISREFPMKRGLDNAYNVMRAVLEAALGGGES